MEDGNKNISLNLFDALMTKDEYIRYLRARIAPIRYGIRALQDMSGKSSSF